MKNGQDRFQIDRDTGRIFTISENPTQQLDRELIDTFYMSIDAIDGGGQRTSVQIIIKLNDLNDNAPQFLNNLFSLNGFTNTSNISNNIIVGFIEENSVKWIEPIRLQAVDRDNGLNGEIIYEIIDGDYMKDFFKIDEITNCIALKENMTIDFEELYKMHQQSNYSSSFPLHKQVNDLIMNTGEIDLNLVINAHDLGFPSLNSKIIAKIIVKDVNDHKPKFDNMFYSAKILETTRMGRFFIITIYLILFPFYKFIFILK
jgi:cadherin 23